MDRRIWSESQCYCFLCGYSSFSGFGLETHELASGPGRAKALENPAAWLRLCNGFHNGCHDLLQGAPVVIGLALKQIADPEHYDLVTVNRLRYRADGAVTQGEVDKLVEFFMRQRGWLTRAQAVEVIKEAKDVAAQISSEASNG